MITYVRYLIDNHIIFNKHRNRGLKELYRFFFDHDRTQKKKYYFYTQFINLHNHLRFTSIKTVYSEYSSSKTKSTRRTCPLDTIPPLSPSAENTPQRKKKKQRISTLLTSPETCGRPPFPRRRGKNGGDHPISGCAYYRP